MGRVLADTSSVEDDDTGSIVIIPVARNAWRCPLVFEVLGACVLQCERALRHGHYLPLPSEPNDYL
jgi:hypothetical protein